LQSAELSLGQRQQAGAWAVKPIDCQDGASFEFGKTVGDGTNQGCTSQFRSQRLTTQQDNTRLSSRRVCQNSREIKVVGDKNEAAIPCILANS